MKLSDVSKTAIMTLRSHVLESQKKHPLIHDPMAKVCLDNLVSLASNDEKALLFDRKLSSTLTSHIAIRARKYDAIVNDFISKKTGCTVINLGCGFDTRYWRIDHDRCKYIELDLPETVALKKKILGNHLAYELIPCSVLNPNWIDDVTVPGNHNFLLIAEGLFMYLSQGDMINLFKALSQNFMDTQIVFEAVSDQYTKGLWKKIVILKMKRELGFDPGSSYNFGVKRASEIEAYGSGIKVIDEWSYVEDPDTRPRILKYLHLTRTQWTITATIN